MQQAVLVQARTAVPTSLQLSCCSAAVFDWKQRRTAAPTGIAGGMTAALGRLLGGLELQVAPWCLYATAFLVLLLVPVTAQGLKPEPAGDLFGASSVPRGSLEGSWGSVLSTASSVWSKQGWQQLRSSRPQACNKRVSNSFCGVDTSYEEAQAALLVATSPAAYDTRNAADNGGFVAAPAPRNQYDCDACVAMVVASAADAAMAMALLTNITEPMYSARYLFLCNTARMLDNSIDCKSGWDLNAALDELARQAYIPMERCLPFLNSSQLAKTQGGCVRLARRAALWVQLMGVPAGCTLHNHGTPLRFYPPHQCLLPTC